MEQKTSTTYVYFSKSEAVISFNKDFMTSIIAKKSGLSGTQFAERRMEVKPGHLRDMNTCLYVRGDAIIDVIKNSPAMTFIAPAVPMLSKIHSLSFISRHEKNAVFTKFWIKFNGNTIGL
jgi:hypothetical protein